MNILKPALLASILLLSGAAFASVTPEGNRHIDVATLLLRKARDMLVTPLPTPRRKAMGTSTGDEQVAWLTDDLKGKGASTPVVVVAHIPLWTVYADWGWARRIRPAHSLFSSGSARSPCSTAISIN